jgi:ABC-type Fe3+ transport system permease subunit
LVIAVLLLAEYTTPHAFGLVVYATELLGWATSSPNVIDAAVASIPLVGIIALLLVALYVRVRGHRRSDRDERAVAGQAGGSLTLLISLGVLAAGLPIGALLLRLSGPEALAVAMHTYGQDVAYSLAVATAAAAASIGLAIAVAYTPRLQRLMVAGTVLCGVVPGALVGEALIASFNRPALSWVYDHWPIVALAYCARFAWIGALTGWLLGCDLRSRLGHQAATDGATRADALLYVTLPRHAALLGGVGVTVIALALAEVASTSMVRVPTFAPISQVIIEKFHRFEDDMLISLSLLLITSAITGALVLACAGERHRSAS